MISWVDKIEEGLAELAGDDTSRLVVPVSALGFKVRENDVISFNELSCTFIPMPELAKERKAKNKKRLLDLFSRGK